MDTDINIAKRRCRLLRHTAAAASNELICIFVEDDDKIMEWKKNSSHYTFYSTCGGIHII